MAKMYEDKEKQPQSSENDEKMAKSINKTEK